MKSFPSLQAPFDFPPPKLERQIFAGWPHTAIFLGKCRSPSTAPQTLLLNSAGFSLHSLNLTNFCSASIFASQEFSLLHARLVTNFAHFFLGDENLCNEICGKLWRSFVRENLAQTERHKSWRPVLKLGVEAVQRRRQKIKVHQIWSSQKRENPRSTARPKLIAETDRQLA